MRNRIAKMERQVSRLRRLEYNERRKGFNLGFKIGEGRRDGFCNAVGTAEASARYLYIRGRTYSHRLVRA